MTVTDPSRARVGSWGRRRQLPGWLRGPAGVLTFLLVWELVPRAGVVNPRYLPPFSEVARALADRVQTQTFWTALVDTLITWATGLSIAVVAGLVPGMGVGSVETGRAA